MSYPYSGIDESIQEAFRALKSNEYQNQIRELQAAFSSTRIQIPDMTSAFTEMAKSLKNIEPMPNYAEYFSNSFNSINSVMKELGDYFNNIDIVIDHDSKQRLLSDGKNHVNIDESNNVILLKKMIKDISFEECADFLNFISNYPMLSYKHKTGKLILRLIASNEKLEISENQMFRVRKHENGKRIPYTDSEMFEAPYTLPMQQRFSSNGQNYLYTSSKLETAILEVGITENDNYTWIELLLKTPMNMLDIRNEEIPLFEYCHFPTSKDKRQLSTEYLLPNFVADCAKISKCDGLLYKSVIRKNTINYVLFGSGKRDFEIFDRGTK